MSGADDLISKWAAQMALLKAEAEKAMPGDERDDLFRRVALCQKAIEAAEMFASPERRVTSPKEPSTHSRA